MAATEGHTAAWHWGKCVNSGQVPFSFFPSPFTYETGEQKIEFDLSALCDPQPISYQALGQGTEHQKLCPEHRVQHGEASCNPV